MQVFIKRVLLFLVLLFVVLTSVFFLSGYLANEGRMGTSFEKHSRLASITSPKIILIGGSNLAYGLDSRALEDSLHMPVINMGIQGSIGLRYMIEEVKPFINPNDIVILVPEHAHFYTLDIDGESSLYRLLSVYPQGFLYLKASQIRNMPGMIGPAIMANFQDAKASVINSLKNKTSFRSLHNKWGDYEGHKSKSTIYKFKEKEGNYSEVSIRSVELINEFDEFVALKKARLFVSFAPIAKSESPYFNCNNIETCPIRPKIISRANDYIFPDNYFYDTGHHLLYDKRNVRSQLLIRDVKNSGFIASDNSKN